MLILKITLRGLNNQKDNNSVMLIAKLENVLGLQTYNLLAVNSCSSVTASVSTKNFLRGSLEFHNVEVNGRERLHEDMHLGNI